MKNCIVFILLKFKIRFFKFYIFEVSNINVLSHNQIFNSNKISNSIKT